MFKVKNDFLYNDDSIVKEYVTPNYSGGKNVCDFVVMHYTGSHGSAMDSINWLQDTNSNVSWHVTIDRNGKVYQTDKGLRSILWHAGKSVWVAENLPDNRRYENLNSYSIGIEMANSGKLEWEDGGFKNSYGQKIDDEKVFIDMNDQAWEEYTDKQVDVAFDVALAIAKFYNCVDILGHEEIAPERKSDPGYAFPLFELKDALRSQDWYKFR